jgi:DNA primase
MNAKQLKQAVKITDFLGINNVPSKNEFFILSPFRQEKTQSFKINQEKNTWYDFGEGCGGSIIDLVCKLNNCNVKDAIKILNEFVDGNYIPTFSFSPAIVKEKKDSKIELIDVDDLTDKRLINYVCNDRKILLKFARKYLKQVTYTINNKTFKAVGFKNDKGGWELRSEKFKGSIAPKSITTIKNANAEKVAIFEGFMDFLSALTYWGADVRTGDVIVLNSLSNLKKVDFSGYYKINLFLDNDYAGRKVTDDLINKGNYIKPIINDYSRIYAGFKDFNEFLQNS